MNYLLKNRWKEALTKMRVIYFFIGLLVPLTTIMAQETEKEDSAGNSYDTEIKKYRLIAVVEMRTGYQFRNSEFQKIELYAKPEWEVQLSKNLRFKAIGRIYLDAMDKLEPGKPLQVEVSRSTQRGFIGDIAEVELRECYIDFKIKNHYLTAGKQQVVWGKADGLKILDVVNPSNFREFLLDDFDNSRIPLWSVKTDIDLRKIKVQLVWIPDQTYHDIPNPGATFYPGAFFSPALPGITVVNNRLIKPDRIFKDADAGFRVSAFIKGWDVTLNYLYMYDDFPVAETSFSNDPVPAIIVSPLYKRLHMAGGTFSNSFGKFSVRGEWGFFIDKYFSAADAAKPAGLFKSTQLLCVAGFDYSGLSNSLISVQVFEDYIFKNTPVINRDRAETYLSLLANRSFKNETITAEIIGVQNIHSGCGFIRPSVKYQYKSNIFLKLGADLFYGPGNDFLGQFHQTNRVIAGIQLGL